MNEVHKELAPIIAKHGIKEVIRAIIGRLDSDAEHVAKKANNIIGHRMSLDLKQMANDIHDALERYDG